MYEHLDPTMLLEFVGPDGNYRLLMGLSSGNDTLAYAICSLCCLLVVDQSDWDLGSISVPNIKEDDMSLGCRFL